MQMPPSLLIFWNQYANRLFHLRPPLQRKIVKDKANHAVVLDKATQDKLQKDVQSYRLITVATLVDRLKINGSLARQSLKDLEDKGQIKKVVGHSKLSIYSKLLAPSPFLRFFVLSEWENECSERGGREEERGRRGGRGLKTTIAGRTDEKTLRAKKAFGLVAWNMGSSTKMEIPKRDHTETLEYPQLTLVVFQRALSPLQSRDLKMYGYAGEEKPRVLDIILGLSPDRGSINGRIIYNWGVAS